MKRYLARRLLLLPLTLFCILLVNFAIINLAPGEPTTFTEISQEGAAMRSEKGSSSFGSDYRFLQFREHYGLTLPILLNFRPYLSKQEVEESLRRLASSDEELSFRERQALRIRLGDQARWTMPQLMEIMENPQEERRIRELAARFFIRGGWRLAALGPNLSERQQKKNQKIASDNQFLLAQMPNGAPLEEKIAALSSWYRERDFSLSAWEKLGALFFETRLFRYLSRVALLDFGTVRDDPNKSVVREVGKRMKYSLTLALTPMLITFALCLLLGMAMAVWQYSWADYTINLCCLLLYGIPIFVAAPFLIEKVALHHTFPFTDTPIPLSGFSSPEREFEKMTSAEKLADIFRHILLPIAAIAYGSIASQARLSRTAFLEALRQDYVRTARAKGLPPFTIYAKHVGRNASITLVTSIAGSLGVILGGSLIVETLFEIDGFGRFFYNAVLNRDYNVIMFSALAGSFLTLTGYFLADLAYTLLDPRVSLEAKE